eukprot:1305895-Amphidinium_carterae.7
MLHLSVWSWIAQSCARARHCRLATGLGLCALGAGCEQCEWLKARLEQESNTTASAHTRRMYPHQMQNRIV